MPADRAPPKVAKVDRKGKKVQGEGNVRPRWEQRLPVRGTALVRAGDKVLVAGSPDVVTGSDPHGAWEGRQGGVLAVYGAVDGTPLAEVQLAAPPVWDGMAVADGRLYLALENNTVVCLE